MGHSSCSEWNNARFDVFSGTTRHISCATFREKGHGVNTRKNRNCYVEWFQATSFPVWGQLLVNTLASQNAYRVLIFCPSISQGKLACCFKQSKKDWARLLKGGWKAGQLHYFIQSPRDTQFIPPNTTFCHWTGREYTSETPLFSSGE